jgi:hypothetical protein
MTIMRLSAIAIVFAALVSPALAQSAHGPSHHRPAYDLRNFRGVYNHVPTGEPIYGAVPMPDGWSAESFGRDSSRVGGVDPSLRPSGS